MTPIHVIAAGAISALGAGVEAYDNGRPGEAARSAVEHDPELERAGLRSTLAARVKKPLLPGRDRAEQLLLTAARQLCVALDARLPGFRQLRIGLSVGTSGGGLPNLERWLDARAAGSELARDPELAQGAFYFGALPALEAELGVAPSERTLVLSACSSSTLALGVGARWLEAGHVDLVIAGGFDALSTFIAAGFDALRATAPSLPQPFRVGREGMALGEGAALLALVRSADHPGEGLGYLLGFGSSSDAVHVTAPDRTGRGLARAAIAALEDAGLGAGEIDLVSAHATATPYNDAAEANAIEHTLGASAERAVVQPYKAVIGHTFGAAGALESLAALAALAAGVLPAAPGSGPIEPALRARLLDRNTLGRASLCLKLSSAFGGANAALVLGKRRPEHARARSAKPIYLRARGRAVHDLDDARLAARLGVDPLRVARIDPLSRLGVAACESALEALGATLPEGSGVVIGSAGATLERNEVHQARVRERGARGAEPRRFPPTSPNLVAGECSILFGLQGPCFAVGAGPAAALEALLVACDLLEAGDAPALVVAAVEEVGPVARDAFVAAGLEVPAAGALAWVLEASDSDPEPGALRLDRGEIALLQREAARAGGRLGQAIPGFPSLQEAFDRLSSR